MSSLSQCPHPAHPAARWLQWMPGEVTGHAHHVAARQPIARRHRQQRKQPARTGRRCRFQQRGLEADGGRLAPAADGCW
ncbi:hypothetical protein XOC_0206 [Xanthomonas oryzae pv. oryzicola BLS256]|uniref:Uncharacterized protein n=1 Tax=Xanthomonas oryzae pv. oryzicola (strain BLS256) TaxID=383407 RepID=G7TJQ1_XANOB|nr:hypothetical protein XOC_0206 [Xanthomonas oryzae pv. oryzicola BLS256]QEO99769.1 hypothetical protein XOCgx_4782 [Xanthomonas oryzae pv. oryzicola]